MGTFEVLKAEHAKCMAKMASKLSKVSDSVLLEARDVSENRGDTFAVSLIDAEITRRLELN